jgi:uncharacterized protein
MDAIYIPQLATAPERTEEIQVQDFLPGLDTLTPIRGKVRVRHCGTYLEVSAQADTIITCTCNRCLQQYNQRLDVDTDEIIWLDEAALAEDLPLEREVPLEDLIESLSPEGYFSPSDWLYEQVCLAIPQRQLCSSDCVGIEVRSQKKSQQPEKSIDSRWSSLEALKKQLPN